MKETTIEQDRFLFDVILQDYIIKYSNHSIGFGIETCVEEDNKYIVKFSKYNSGGFKPLTGLLYIDKECFDEYYSIHSKYYTSIHLVR